MKDDLRTIYLDDEGNVVFHDEYLEELLPKIIDVHAGTCNSSNRTLTKDIILEKFDGKNIKADTWMKLFIQECETVGVKQESYAQILDTFSVQTWSEIAYAYDFKFLNGSYLDYALKKRNLLLEVDENISVNTQIDLIVISLPRFIQERLTFMYDRTPL